MAHHKTTSSRWGILLIGIFVGIVLGLVMALTAAWKLGGNAVVEVFSSKNKPAATQRPSENAPTAKTDGEKPSFDFYKVLPEGGNTAAGNDKPAEQRPTHVASIPETPSTRTTPATTSPPPTPVVSTKSRETYWLQVGSFSRQEDADNRKAELALYGWEAAIQKAESPGRGTLYRVRVGPFDNAEQTGRMKAELTQRKFDVAVVRQ